MPISPALKIKRMQLLAELQQISHSYLGAYINIQRTKICSYKGRTGWPNAHNNASLTTTPEVRYASVALPYAFLNRTSTATKA